MQDARWLARVKREHARLYDLLGKNRTGLLAGSPDSGGQGSIGEVRLSEIEALVNELKVLARRVDALDDYRWVSDALLKWQVTVTNVLDEPINTDVPPMSRFLSAPTSLTNVLDEPIDTDLPRMPSALSAPTSPAGRCLTLHEVEHLLRSLAEASAAHRKLLTGRRSSPEEMIDDYNNAQALFALDVISGKINFPSRIGPDCYPILQQTWLKEAKSVLAYLLWLDRVDDRLISDPLDDYFRAVWSIRNLLVNEGIKAKRQEFDIVKGYLDRRYLANGFLDYGKREEARTLVQIKARRVYDVTRNADAEGNWLAAERFTKLFYENITPAAVESNKEATLNVLKAFQFSKAPEHQYWIITSFEAILAIYFLDVSLVRQLWDESAAKGIPEAAATSTVKVASWPDGFVVPESCRSTFSYSGSEILFRGVMSGPQLDDLSKGLNATQLGALRELFERSRLIREEATL